jgi:hypothetical protein
MKGETCTASKIPRTFIRRMLNKVKSNNARKAEVRQKDKVEYKVLILGKKVIYTKLRVS